MSRRLAMGIAALVVAVALTGCIGSPPHDAPTAATSAPSASSSPSPAPVNTQDPATWIVSQDGIGPFAIGASMATVSEGLPAFVDTTADCPSPVVTFLEADRLSVTVIRTTGTDDSIAHASLFDRVDSYESATSSFTPATGPHTSAGIGLGSTLSDLRAAYPGIEAIKQFPDDEDAYQVVKYPNGMWLTFTTSGPNDLVTNMGLFRGSLPPYEYC